MLEAIWHPHLSPPVKGPEACSPLLGATQYSAQSTRETQLRTRHGLAYRIRDAIGKSNELNCVFRVSPFGSQCEDKVECRFVRVGIIVVLRYVP
jgi:hypothetical protein